MSLIGRFRKVQPQAIVALAGGLLAGALIFAAVQVISYVVRNHLLEEAAHNEARFAAARPRSSDQIRTDLYQKAQALGLPVEMEAIKVQSLGREDGPTFVQSMLGSSPEITTTAFVDIDVAYVAPVKLPGWTFHLNFQFHVDDRHI